MKKQSKTNNIILILLLLVLLNMRLYMILSICIILVTCRIVSANAGNILRNIKSILKRKKDIENLKYFYITDSDKLIDKQKRVNVLQFSEDFTVGVYFTIMLNLVALCYLLMKINIPNNWISGLAIIIIMLLSFLVMINYIIKFVFKYTTFSYILIPFISFLIYIIFHEYFDYYTTWIEFIIYLSITGMLFTILIYKCPLYVLRQLGARSVIITVIITFSITLLIYLLSYYFEWFIVKEHYLLNLDKVKMMESEMIRKFFIDNPGAINVFNQFFKNVIFDELNTYISLYSTFITISYSFSGMLILIRISKNKNLAKSKFRDILLKSSYDYTSLIYCAYLGGEEYENLILNNDRLREVVIDHEKEMTIPNDSFKKIFIQKVTRLLTDIKVKMKNLKLRIIEK